MRKLTKEQAKEIDVDYIYSKECNNAIYIADKDLEERFELVRKLKEIKT